MEDFAKFSREKYALKQVLFRFLSGGGDVQS